MKKEARFWDKQSDHKVQCHLCANECVISPDKTGICGVRKNEGGTLYTLIYNSCSSVAVDPIEKKPLYHFHPGTNALSLGTVGCTLRCQHCQNFSISRGRPEEISLRDLPPREAVDLAKQHSAQGIAWTYNEPTIWHEYTYDSAQLAKKENLYTAYVTNGYIQEDPLRELAPFLDAMNVDVKAFTNDFYQTICKGELQPVLNTCGLAKELGIFLEVTYLVIPGHNDSEDELHDFCRWVYSELGEDTPVHFSRFHPHYKMNDVSMTPIDTLMKAHKIAKTTGLAYVYLGNVPHGEYENTTCPKCGASLVERTGFRATITGLKNGACSQCGQDIPIIT